MILQGAVFMFYQLSIYEFIQTHIVFYCPERTIFDISTHYEKISVTCVNV